MNTRSWASQECYYRSGVSLYRSRQYTGEEISDILEKKLWGRTEAGMFKGCTMVEMYILHWD